MKCIGARSSQLMRIYLHPDRRARAWPAGCWASPSASRSSESSRHFSRATSSWSRRRAGILITAAQGIGIAILATLLFTLPPLLGIRRIRPSLILRREMAETKAGLARASARSARFHRCRVAVIVVGFAGIAMSFATGTPADIWKTGAYFAGALVVSLAVLSGIAWLMLRGLKIASRRKLPTSIRHGIANLYRPGNHAQTVLVALGIGVMFTLTVYLVQRGVIAEMNRTAPPGMPNVFLIDITPKDREAVLDAAEEAARRRRRRRADRHRGRQAGRSGWRGHSEESSERLGPTLPLSRVRSPRPRPCPATSKCCAGVVEQRRQRGACRSASPKKPRKFSASSRDP